MLRKGILLCLWSLSLCAVDTQAVSCTDDDQCSEGYYCVKEVPKCTKCLSCEALQREPPLTSNPCIKSVAECGACFKGMVVDHLGDVNSACVVSGSEESGATPPYVWWLVSAVIIFLALTILIIIYVYLNPGIFENLKFRGNCQSGVNIRAEARPSAPEAPPPYAPPQYNDIPYSSVRTTESPCPPHQEPENGGRVYFEEEGPIIKRSSTAQPGRARQAAGTEAANVYNLPFYERQDLPSSDTTPTVTELNDNLAIHDEETMESIWSPSGPTNGDVNSNASEVVASSAGTTGAASAGAAGDSLPAMLAAARDTSLIEHTPPKQLCIRPPATNRNRCSNPGGDGNQGNFSGSQNGAPYFVTQITNVVQFSRTN